MRNLLPTAENLWKRKVMHEPIRQMCKAKCENVFHALMECKVARKIWKFMHLEDEVKQMIRKDMLSVMYKLTDNLDNNEFNYVAAI